LSKDYSPKHKQGIELATKNRMAVAGNIGQYLDNIALWGWAGKATAIIW
jgi:hypothetical protein